MIRNYSKKQLRKKEDKVIMVIGGYGQVGGLVSEQLQQVIVAGRNMDKAEGFIKEKNINGRARKIDTKNIDKDDLEDVDTIIMCTEDHNIDVLLKCLEEGINYIDISPSYQVLKEIESYRDKIEEVKIRVVLGVGIAPGVSNLLCKEAAKEFDKVDSIDSYLMLGLGEKHGANAILWFLNNLTRKVNDGTSFVTKKVIDAFRVKKTRKQTFTRMD